MENQSKTYRCCECGKEHDDETLVVAEDGYSKFSSPGALQFPSGECSDCGGLCYEVKPNGSSSTLSFQDILDDISEVLQGADGAYVAQIHNQLCSGQVRYLGDSLYERVETCA